MTGWGFTDRPAVTVGNAVGRGLIGGTGAKAAITDAIEAGTFTASPHGDASSFAEITRITVDEAARLQTYDLPSHYRKEPVMHDLIALDDFAGTGWGVACQRLGIAERGVEIMPEARATREANGMHTVGADIWEHLEATAETPLAYDLLISSPPCQTFSMAGGGAGRRALDEVVGLIDSRACADVAQLRAFGETHDPRTALVLTPLVRVYRDTPTHVVLEQVPPVLPVWERMAAELRAWGYSVVTGVLNAEQYGVPQTRRRAVLIARADGVEARMPTPTHSRYYSRDPKRLDPGVLPWVSMAEALGWGNAVVTSNYGTGGDSTKRGERSSDEPAATVTSKIDRAVVLPGAKVRTSMGAPKADGSKERQTRDAARPAPTVTSGTRSAKWQQERPATTLAGDPRVAAPGWRGGRADYEAGRPIENQHDRSTRVTVDEAAALQSYPPAFVWCGTKTKQFLQIGNAVPPLLAEAILRTIVEGEASA